MKLKKFRETQRKRRFKIYKMCQKPGVTQEDVGKIFGIDRATVASTCARVRAELKAGENK